MQGHFKASISILLFTDHRCILLQPLQTGADVQQAAWNAFTTSSKVSRVCTARIQCFNLPAGLAEFIDRGPELATEPLEVGNHFHGRM
jgi:hypothetical protein